MIEKRKGILIILAKKADKRYSNEKAIINSNNSITHTLKIEIVVMRGSITARIRKRLPTPKIKRYPDMEDSLLKLPNRSCKSSILISTTIITKVPSKGKVQAKARMESSCGWMNPNE